MSLLCENNIHLCQNNNGILNSILTLHGNLSHTRTQIFQKRVCSNAKILHDAPYLTVLTALSIPMWYSSSVDSAFKTPELQQNNTGTAFRTYSHRTAGRDRREVCGASWPSYAHLFLHHTLWNLGREHFLNESMLDRARKCIECGGCHFEHLQGGSRTVVA